MLTIPRAMDLIVYDRFVHHALKLIGDHCDGEIMPNNAAYWRTSLPELLGVLVRAKMITLKTLAKLRRLAKLHGYILDTQVWPFTRDLIHDLTRSPFLRN